MSYINEALSIPSAQVFNESSFAVVVLQEQEVLDTDPISCRESALHH